MSGEELPLNFAWHENKTGEVVITWHCISCACENEFVIPPPYSANGILNDFLDFYDKTCEMCNKSAFSLDHDHDEDECDW